MEIIIKLRSEIFHLCKMFRFLHSLHNFVSIFYVFFPIFHPRVEYIPKWVFSHIFTWYYAHCFGVRVVLLQPQRSQICNCVYFVPMLLDVLFKVFGILIKMIQHSAYDVGVFPDKGQNRLPIIFGKVFCFASLIIRGYDGTRLFRKKITTHLLFFSFHLDRAGVFLTGLFLLSWFFLTSLQGDDPLIAGQCRPIRAWVFAPLFITSPGNSFGQMDINS